MIKRTKILLCHVIVGMIVLLEFSANANAELITAHLSAEFTIIASAASVNRLYLGLIIFPLN